MGRWGGDEGIKLNLSTTKTKSDYKNINGGEQKKSHHLRWSKKFVGRAPAVIGGDRDADPLVAHLRGERRPSACVHLPLAIFENTFIQYIQI